MGGDGDEDDPLKAALDRLYERYGEDRVRRAVNERKKRGRPEGSAKYRDGDIEPMLEAYDEYLRMIARFHRDPTGRHPKPTTYGALKRVAELAWVERPQCRGGASTPDALVRRLRTRFEGKEEDTAT